MDCAGRTVVAMSGGVDSSVVAALMKEQGHDVVGVTLQLRPCDDNLSSKSCCGIDGPMRARAVAGILGIPHYVVNCEREFEERILRPAWSAYASGRTPSPCLWCNERIKFGLLMEWAHDVGAAQVATGHYARCVDGPEGPQLWRAVDAAKDQSYFLSRVGVERLRRARFPLGGMCKPEVRALAARFGLPTAATPDSQDVCLVAEGSTFPETLRVRFGAAAQPGVIADAAGRVLGRHDGIHHFTIGQRKGLGIANAGRHWVTRIDAVTGTVAVAPDEQALAATVLTVDGMAWLAPLPASWPLACAVQVRHRHTPAPALVEDAGDGTFRIRFQEPVRAATPGQAAVCYDGERVLGGGWIRAVG